MTDYEQEAYCDLYGDLVVGNHNYSAIMACGDKKGQKKTKKEERKSSINSNDKLGLAGLSRKFPDKVQLLDDPNVWIGDTAATVHMTPHAIGFIKNQDDKSKSQSITVGNGKQEVAMMHGMVKGQMVNKNGEEMGTAVFTDVTYAPNMKFNLCSLSKLMKMAG